MAEYHKIDIARAKNLFRRIAKHQLANPDRGWKNVFIHGAPALGKSQIVREVAEEIGADFIDVRLAGVDASAVLGLPYVWEGSQFFSTHTWFPTGERPTIIFFDELKNALPDTLVASFALILDRKLQNGKKLPDNVIIVAAGNMRTDKTGARELSVAMATRFAVHMVIDPESAKNTFIPYAIDRKLNPHIIGYCSWKRDHIYFVGSNDDSITSAVPRTWELLSGIMEMFSESEYDSDEFYDATLGCVGSVVGANFCAYMKFASKLPDWSRVRSNDPTYEYKIPREEPAIEFGVATGLAVELIDVVENDSCTDLTGYAEIANQLQDEMLIVFFRAVRSSIRVGVSIISNPLFSGHWERLKTRIK